MSRGDIAATKVRVNGVDYIVFANGYTGNGYSDAVDIVSFDGEIVNVVTISDSLLITNARACTLKCADIEYVLL